MVSWQVYAVAVLAMGGLSGLALGAESQKETFLRPEKLQEDGFNDAASNLVTLTALLPALAAAIMAGFLGQSRFWPRCAGIFGVFVATFALTWLIQSSWPNYDAVEELRMASFSITPLVSNGAAVPSVFLGVMCLIVGLGQVFMRAVHALATPTEVQPASATATLRRFLASYLFGALFLVVLVAGNLRLVTSLDSAQAAAVPYLLVLPLGALAALGLLVIGAVKAWHLGAFARNERLRDATISTWEGLRRTEWALLGVLVGLALLATLFKAIPHPLLEAGRTFSVTTRGHVQAQAFLVFPLMGWLLAHKPAMQALQGPGGQANMSTGTHPMVVASIVVLSVALPLTILITWLARGALWPWMAAGLLLTGLAWAILPGNRGAVALLTAVVTWGIGNSVTGSFALNEQVDVALDTAPGVQVLLRMIAVLILAIAVARATRFHARMPPAFAWPLAVGAAIATALVPYLEFPFTAWIASTIDGEFVGIGSLVASQDQSVRTALHGLGAVASFAAGIILARIVRPDWFAKKPPLPELAPVASAT